MKKQITFIFIVLLLFIASFDNSTYSRYVLTRNINTEVSSAPFYFNAERYATTINFPRTDNQKDFDQILTEETPVKFKISNNDGSNFNNYQVTYEISVVGSDKFTLSEGETVTKTIDGGSLKNEDITVTLKIKDLTKTDDTVKIRVTSTFPYSKTFEFEYKVTQDGAIQYIEDLVDMALGIRNRDNPNNLKTADIQNERFKMTRDLDFNDSSSYKDSTSDAYGDINGNSTFGENIYNELTSDTGFLPIGELDHPFQGAFNGGGYTINNLHIHKALQSNIGFFGTIQNATIKNLTIKNGYVYNENQTAGMLVGKVVHSVIEYVTVSGNTVMSVDTVHTTQDTYTGGIAGYVSEGSTVSYCKNYANVTTQFTGDYNNYSGPAGGIAAWMSTSNVDHCENYGTITGQRYIGGIAGFFAMHDATDETGYGTASDCINHGTVKSYITTSSGTLGYYVGGIIGYNRAHGVVQNNINYEDAVVSGISGVGGIVGNNAKIGTAIGTVRNNTNYSSNITGGATAHGIAGSWTGYSGKTGTDTYGNVNSPK